MIKDKNMFVMLLFTIFAILILLTLECSARTIKIAVIDSGITDTTHIKLCEPPVNFTSSATLDAEYHKHGDNITHIIIDGLDKEDYCVYILKVFSETVTPSNNLFNSTRAIAYAIDKKVDIINLSSGGKYKYLLEYVIVKYALEQHIIFIAAAGNENEDLDKDCNYYPACIPGVISVGNLDRDGKRERHSNYGRRVAVWKMGTLITAGNITLTGSSQATAIYTREVLIKKLKEQK